MTKKTKKSRISRASNSNRLGGASVHSHHDTSEPNPDRMSAF
jgi:hypothetical protein